jgi:hypothetical protein
MRFVLHSVLLIVMLVNIVLPSQAAVQPHLSRIHPATTQRTVAPQIDTPLEPLFIPIVRTAVPTSAPTPLTASNTNGCVAKELARRWASDDAVVANRDVQRIWHWGAQVLTSGQEPYAEAPGGKRAVWYFDKTRMEITNPSGDPDSPWYVTTGLLVDELVGGFVQLGDHTQRQSISANIPIAGDAVDPAQMITYRDLRPVATIYDEHRSPQRIDTLIVDVLGKNGAVTQDARFSTYNARTGTYRTTKGHNIANVFTAVLPTDRILYLAGEPMAEPYWVTVLANGQPTDILIQAFDRRVLTYTPSNPSWARVEWGNVGRHYAQWRYGTATNIVPFDPRSILDASPTAQPLANLSAAAVQVANGRPSNEGVAVFNMHSGDMYSYNSATRFPMYSTVKAPIMLTLLDQAMRAGRSLTAEEDGLVKKMIQYSDNDATSTLYYRRIGGEAAVESFLRKHSITDTDLNPTAWGLSTTTAQDMARLMGKLGNCTILDRRWCDYALNMMRNVTSSQYWGVSAGVPDVDTTRSVALKNGWYPESGWLMSADSSDVAAPEAQSPSIDGNGFGAPRGYSEAVPWSDDPDGYAPNATGWAINSVGFVKANGKLYAIAAYTRPSSTMQYGIDTIEAMSRNIYPAVPSR